MGILDDLRAGLGSTLSRIGTTLGGDDLDDVPADAMRKALAERGIAPDGDGGMPQPTDEKPRGLFHDPYSVIDWGGWRERPSSLTYETLRQMTAKNTVIAALITLRANQIAQFSRPQQGKYDRGYRIIKRDRRDRWKSMTPIEQKRANEIERMIETTGMLQPNEKPSDRDSFALFVKKAVRDILTYDQWCFEKLRDRRGMISRFIALPSESIRPAVSDSEHLDPEEKHSRVAYVQVYEDSVIAEFSPEDMAWCIMNPRSDLRVNGFGYSPVEQLMHLITAWLFGFEYNQRFFSQGSAIKGILNIKGAIPDRQLRAFRRMWYSQVTGVTNAWRTPILNSEDIQWQSLHSTNREMEFSAWMDWLTKLTCAVYGADPIEINFQFGNTGQSQSMKEGGQEAKLSESKDKGLRPLMDHISDNMNRHLVWDIEDEFEFAFMGLDSEDEEKEREARIKEVGAYRMVDEVRADDDLPPLPDGNGQVINNPTWLQFVNAKQQAAQQAQMAAAGQPPGAPGAPGAAPPGSPPLPPYDTDGDGDTDGVDGAEDDGAPEPPDEEELQAGEVDENALPPEDQLERAMRNVRHVDRLVKSVSRRTSRGRMLIEVDLDEGDRR
jgi:hypothetical protein